MKPRRNLFLGSLLAFSMAQAAQATTYWWDTLIGSWGLGANWSDAASIGTTGTVPLATDSVVFNQSSVNGFEVISLDADRSITGITFNNTGTTAIQANSSGTTGRTLTIGTGGITVNGGAGPVTLGGGSFGTTTLATSGIQSWTNNGVLTVNGPLTVNNALTLGGSGLTTFTGGTSPAADWTGSGGVIKTGTGVLNIAGNISAAAGRWTIGNGYGGNFTMQQGALNASGIAYITIGEQATSAATYTQTGGTVLLTPSSDASGNGVYINNSTSGTGTSEFNISGGSFTLAGTSTRIYVGRGASGTTGNLNIGSGAGLATVTAANIRIADASGRTGNVNLNSNGVLETSAITKGSGTGNLYFDGGTLRVRTGTTAATDIVTGLSAAQIKNGGAIIDTNGINVSIGQGFANFSGNTGSLTKVGAGTLTLSGANSYTGATTISRGTLTLASTSSLSTSSAITVNGTGGFSYTGAAAGSSTTVGALTRTAGDGTITSTYGTSGNVALTFSSLTTPRSAGATANFVVSGGSNGTTNKIVLTGVTTNSFIDHGTFFGGSNYAWYDTAGYVRAINYNGTEGVTTAGGLSLASATHQETTAAVTAQDNATFTTLKITGANAITLGASKTVTVNGILKTGTTATISGGSGIQAASGTDLVVRTDVSADALQINTPILANGTNALVKTGAGSLTLGSLAVNTFTGGTYVNQGTLVVSQDSHFGSTAASNPVYLNGGGLQVTSSITLNANHPISVGVGGGSIYGNGNGFVLGAGTGMLTGSGPLALTGSATTVSVLSSSGTKNYTGSMTVSSGRLVLAATNITNPFGTGDITVNGSGSIFVNNSGSIWDNRFFLSGVGGETRGILRLNAGATFNGEIVVAGTSTINSDSSSSSTSTFNGVISGSSALTFGQTSNSTASSIYALTGSNLLTGQINVTNGILRISNTNALGNTSTGTVINSGGSGTARIELTGGVTFAPETVDFSGRTTGSTAAHLSNLSGNNVWTGNITTNISGDTYTIESQAGNLTMTGSIGVTQSGNRFMQFSGAGNGEVFGVISGSSNNAAVIKQGAGTWKLSGLNTYTGPTSIQQGTLSINTIKDYNSASSLGAPTSGDMIIGAAANTGTLVYTGGVQSTNRTIQIGDNSGTPASTDTGGSTIQNDGTGALTFSATTFNTAETSVIASTARVLTLSGSNAGNNTISGIIQDNTVGASGTGAVALTKSGNGTWVLGGVNTYMGASTINGGTLTVSSAGVINDTNATSGGATVSGGATLRIDGGTAKFNTTASDQTALQVGSTTAGNVVVTNNGALTISTGRLILGDTGGSATSTFTQDSGTTTVASNLYTANFHASDLFISGGSFNVSGSAVISQRANTNFNISGTADVVFPTITLGGQAGTYNANINLNGGTLSVDNIANSTNGTTAVNFNGGTLKARQNNTAFLAADTATIANNGATIDSGIYNITLGQALLRLSGATTDSLTKIGTGSLTLSGGNTYGGGTLIQNGSIIIGVGNDRLLTTGTVTLGAASTTGKLVLGDGTARNQTLAGLTTTGLGGSVVGGAAANSTLTLNIASGTNTFGGTLGGAGANEGKLALTKNGAGTLVLSGSNSFAGNIVMGADSGNLRITNSSALGSGAKTFTNTSASSGSPDGANLLDLDSNGGPDIELSADISFSTSGSAGVVRNIAGNNTIKGTFSMNLGNGNTKIISNGGSLKLTGNISAATTNRALELSGTSIGSNEFSGILSNGSTPSLIKSGVGKWILSGANTFQGATTISGGTLALTNNLALQYSALNTDFTGGGALDLTAVNTPTIGGFSGTVNRVLPANVTSLTLNPQSGTATYSGGVSGGTGLALTKSGAGTQVLSGSNTFGGDTTISGGYLNIANNNALNGSSAVVVTTTGGGGALQLANGITVSGKSITVNGYGINVRGSLQAAASATAEWAGTVILGNTAADSRVGAAAGGVLTLSGQIQNGFTNNLLISAENAVSATPGKVIVSGTSNSYTGQTQIFRGILAIGADNALPTGTVLNVHAGSSISDTARFDLNGYNQEVAGLLRGNTSGPAEVTNTGGTVKKLTINNTTDYTYDSAITGNVELEKKGSGAQTLTGSSNTYTGATTVTSGKLVINGNISTSTTTVKNTGTLGGSGTTGAVIVENGGTLAPGNSPGTLTITGDLGLNDSSIVAFEFNPLDMTVGGGINDLVTITGGLTLNGLLNVTATSGNFLGATNGDTWRLFNYSGSLTNNILTLNTMPDLGTGYSWAVDTATAGQVNLVVVPEPRAAILGLLGTLALLRRRR